MLYDLSPRAGFNRLDENDVERRTPMFGTKDV